MVKIVSYRQKLIELAKIYKIDKVFDQNVKLTTYDIEIILLKNKVPIPSRRGYVSHKLINEVFKPSYDKFKNFFSIDINFKVGKNLKNFYEKIRKKSIININISKYVKKFFNSIEDYFKFIVSNIVNFFKTLSKIIIDSLNDIYNFQVKEKVLKNIFLKTGYASLVAILVFSGFYIKDFVTDVDTLKISLEIKSDKKINDKNSKKRIL